MLVSVNMTTVIMIVSKAKLITMLVSVIEAMVIAVFVQGIKATNQEACSDTDFINHQLFLPIDLYKGAMQILWRYLPIPTIQLIPLSVFKIELLLPVSFKG